MTADMLVALTGFAFVTSWTPGPNTTMLAASGANYGLRRTLPHILGITLGFPAMFFLAALGLGGVMRALPALEQLLRWAGAAVLLWLAWRIGTARRGPDGGSDGRPMSLLGAAAFQWINPKAWMIAAGVVSQHAGAAASLADAAAIAALFLVVTGWSCVGWAAFGAAIGRVLSTPARLRLFNAAMGLLLAAFVVAMLGG
jgi:threonine/homoserine/homoserine lactone efflux protein